MTKLKLDKVVVLDLEATCWQGEPPKGQTSEIIEIGACFLNMKNLEIEDERSYIVKPRFSEVSEYCTKLTSLTPEQVSRGIPFNDALNKFKKEYGVRNRSWGSWGVGDKSLFLRNCKLYEIGYPLNTDHLNISTIFSLRYRLSKRIGVVKALEHLGLEFEGRLHRAINDSYNTARILRETIR